MCVRGLVVLTTYVLDSVRTHPPTHTHIIKIPNQLGHAKHAQGPTTFAEMRKLAASYLRSHPDDFLPFMDLPEGETDAEGR